MVYYPDEDGQGLAEYALILMLVALLLITLVTIFGNQVMSFYSTVVSAIPTH